MQAVSFFRIDKQAKSIKMLLYFGIILFLTKASFGQLLNFPNGIKIQSQNGRGTGNWTADGRMRLTRMDGIVFEPRVDVQLVTGLCSIDLRWCAPKGSPQTTLEGACHCVKDSDEEYSLHITGHGHASHDDVTVQAIAPSRFVFSPLTLAAHVGKLPLSDEIKPDPQQTQNVNDETRPSQKPDTCAQVPGSSPRQVVTLSSGLEVVCDTETDNGGWVVIQRRQSKYYEFDGDWEDFKYGFGNLYGDFWFGLEKVYRLAFQRRYELRVDLVIGGESQFAHYRNFTLRGEQENYKIRVSGFSGNATDDLSRQDKAQFSTVDRDNDQIGSKSCATHYQTGWWYTGCFGDAIHGRGGYSWWATTALFSGLDITFSEMKIRPLES